MSTLIIYACSHSKRIDHQGPGQTRKRNGPCEDCSSHLASLGLRWEQVKDTFIPQLPPTWSEIAVWNNAQVAANEGTN
jgi:hypothetical protein